MRGIFFPLVAKKMMDYSHVMKLYCCASSDPLLIYQGWRRAGFAELKISLLGTEAFWIICS